MLNKIIPPSTPTLIEDLGTMYPKETSTYKKSFGMYRCECGNIFKSAQASIKSGLTKSCGCYQRKYRIEIHTTHGLKKHPLYNTWSNIIARCSNKNADNYKYYGDIGISMCDEWRNNFKVFYDWSMANGYEKGLTIDRRNNDGNYEPSNCRWTTKNIQAQNTRLINIRNKSGYRGVCFDKNFKKWLSQIRVNSKNIYLGRYKSSFEAAVAYDNYVIENNLEHTINGVS